jgi:Mrp family chromosome partitioning ATPase
VIYTFYSFKGGVGRSMALANVAELFYKRGLRVLMVDFDLEAPGLERYFNTPDVASPPEQVFRSRGVIDLLCSYQEMRKLAPWLPSASDRGIAGGAFIAMEPLENFRQCLPFGSTVKTGISVEGAGQIRQAMAF